MRIEIGQYNYEHGGRTALDGKGITKDYSGDGGPFDFRPLARAMSAGDYWPHILVLNEGDYYEFNGMEGGWEAADAMRRAGGRPYVPLLGSLPRQWGPFAPVVFVDPQVIRVLRWYDHRAADFASRNRNLLIAKAGKTRFRLVATHGDIHSGDTRLADAREFERFANPSTPCAIVGDWNSTPSGPMWEETDLDELARRAPNRLLGWWAAWRVRWQHGPVKTYRPDTRALDFLCGYWDHATSAREGGVGFWDVAELAKDGTPTQLTRPIGKNAPPDRQPRTLDRAVLNEPFKDAYVTGSYTVFEPVDPDHPDSDHKRIQFALEL